MKITIHVENIRQITDHVNNPCLPPQYYIWGHGALMSDTFLGQEHLIQRTPICNKKNNRFSYIYVKMCIYVIIGAPREDIYLSGGGGGGGGVIISFSYMVHNVQNVHF